MRNKKWTHFCPVAASQVCIVLKNCSSLCEDVSSVYWLPSSKNVEAEKTRRFPPGKSTTEENIFVTWGYHGESEANVGCWVRKIWGGRSVEGCMGFLPDFCVLLQWKTWKKRHVLCKACYHNYKIRVNSLVTMVDIHYLQPSRATDYS